MGAETFIDNVKANTAKEAFTIAREQAAYDRGHGGYTGTIAEKTSFVMIPLPRQAAEATASEIRSAAELHAEKLLDEQDPRIDDKWGPAGCIDRGDGGYTFFGWASS